VVALELLGFFDVVDEPLSVPLTAGEVCANVRMA
jgi:hypothetical protein